MQSVLITGSNRGIGLEIVRQYANLGWHVLATCRNPINVGELSRLPGMIDVHSLDINDSEQLMKLSDQIKHVSLDLLICNAGIYGPSNQSLDNCDGADWLNTFRTNTIAPLNVCRAFLPHLMTKKGKIVVLSSKMGSIEQNSSGGLYQYRSSKAALNAVVKSLAYDLEPRSIPVCSLHPGWVQTDMGGKNALISSEESVRGMRKVIENLSISTTGLFLDYNGVKVEW